MELTLFRFSEELVLVQALKHFPNVLDGSSILSE